VKTGDLLDQSDDNITDPTKDNGSERRITGIANRGLLEEPTPSFPDVEPGSNDDCHSRTGPLAKMGMLLVPAKAVILKRTKQNSRSDGSWCRGSRLLEQPFPCYTKAVYDYYYRKNSRNVLLVKIDSLLEQSERLF
jgi:hypothetical protein